MKKILIGILTVSLMLSFIAVGTTYAQEKPEVEEPNPVCVEGSTFEHPVLMGMADHFEEVDYEVLVGYFCEYEMGIGEIALGLFTIQRMEGELTFEDLLTQRFDEELGWGEIWQDLGLIGNGRNNDDEVDGAEGESLENSEQRGLGNRPLTPPGLIGKDKGKPDNLPGPASNPGKGNGR